ncbi:MAG: hypothetical protein KGP29_00275 [Proteobacteria bacterium]|nr:hypothetical protein [Pseudomonadota bacterium]
MFLGKKTQAKERGGPNSENPSSTAEVGGGGVTINYTSSLEDEKSESKESPSSLFRLNNWSAS